MCIKGWTGPGLILETLNCSSIQVEVLLALSMANAREMVKTVLPLKQLTPEEAARLVVKHLVNRSRSLIAV